MTFIDQTILASDPKRKGNCLPACVATFLDLPLERVPHFIECGIAWNEGREDDTVGWWAMFLGFMAGHGWWPVELDSIDSAPGEVIFVMGMSNRGVQHQVLYRDGVLWFDPHPSRDGVTDIREVLTFRPAAFDHAPTATENSERD